jgi:peptidoglycan/xylan/chitin deacetylase (PgdA/CDA1 family)
MLIRLTKVAISAGVAAADTVRARLRRMRGAPPPSTLVVLYYHAVRAAHRGLFERQMAYLSAASTPVRADAARLDASGRRYTAITFDDCFVSVVENALPVLRARGIPCSIFVPSGSVGAPPAWIESEHADAGEIVASRDVIRGLAADPLIEIGSHSVRHPRFPSLDAEQALHELRQSKAQVEEITGRPAASFSFPHGAHTGRDVTLARQAGYARVLTIEPETIGGGVTPFVIGRTRVEPDDWALEFRLKAAGAYRWQPLASRWKRSLRSLLGKRRVPPASAAEVQYR